MGVMVWPLLVGEHPHFWNAIFYRISALALINYKTPEETLEIATDVTKTFRFWLFLLDNLREIKTPP
jgi:hypothetical protein